MQSRPFGAILAVLVGVAAASAQPVPYPDSPPAAIPFDDGGASVMGGDLPAGFDGGPAPYRWWLSAEYMLGFTRTSNQPSVVSISPAASGGIVGLPGTRMLSSSVPDLAGGVSGARFTGGVWLDSCRAYGVDWGVFFLPRQQSTNTFQAGAGEVLARPFFDTAFGVENSRRISAPGIAAGSVSTTSRSLFWGAELGARLRVLETPTLSLEQLFHFRYAALEESFEAEDTSSALGGGVVAFNGQLFPAPARVRVNDYFGVINRFYGGSAGLRLIWTPGRWEVRLDGRMGVGTVEQTITLDGFTRLENVGPTTSLSPGFYTAAQGTGVSRHYRLSLAPDVQARVGYRLTDWLMLTAGYQFAYMTNVARPADVISRRINSAQIPSSQNFGSPAPPVPGFPTIVSSDFWMHGLTAGLMLTF